MKFVHTLSIIFIFFTIIGVNAPSFGKKAAIIIDYDSEKVLFEINADTLNYPASLAKMMTIYIVFDNLKKNKLSWNTKMKVSKIAASRSPTKLHLLEGSTISVKDAVNALIVKSANDVATVVAENISGSERKFAKLMTNYARNMGMSKTTYKNASGLPNRAQLTSARDTATLSIALIYDFPEYYNLFSKEKFTWKGKTYKTHNRLMKSYEGADGIKTGYILSSGFQLAFSAVRDNKRLIGIYFGGDTAKQRDQRLSLLMNKGFKEFDIQKLSASKKISQKKSTNKLKIVVGTFKYLKNAKKQIEVIRKHYPKTTSNKEAKVVKVKISKGHLYETRFQFFSKKEAKIACSRLKKYNRDCFIRN